MAHLAQRSAACTAIKRMFASLTAENVLSDWDLVRTNLEHVLLDQHFERFKAAHEVTLQDLKDPTEEDFEAHDQLLLVVERQYIEASSVLLRHLQQIQADTLPLQVAQPEIGLDVLVARRSAAIAALQRLHTLIMTTDLNSWDLFRIHLEQKALESYFNRFQDVHEQTVSPKCDIGTHDEMEQEVITMYHEAVAALQRRVRQVEPTPVSLPPTKLEMKLESIQIPTFSGELHNWLQFKDAFETLVHNADLLMAYKLQKLRDSVKATEVGLFGSVFSGGYEELWTTLKERFDNPRLLAEAHVSRFLGVPPAIEETPREMMRIRDAVVESLRALRVMDQPVDSWDTLTVHVIMKLPKVTQQAWNMHCHPREIPSLIKLLQFVEQRGHSLGAEMMRQPFCCQLEMMNPTSSRKASKPCKVSRNNAGAVAATSRSSCMCCGGNHRISKCKDFSNWDQNTRFKFARAKNRCFNCLLPDHRGEKGPSNVSCKHCNKRHHSLLCDRSTKPTPTQSVVPYENRNHGPSEVFGPAPIVLLATALIHAYSHTSGQLLVRALCDPGSQVSLIKTCLSERLRMPRARSEIAVQGIGESRFVPVRDQVTLSIRSTCNAFSITIKALVIPVITADQPESIVDMTQWPHLAGLQLADKHFGTPAAIDLLLGADVWGSLVEDGVIHGQLHEPHAQRTRFGWVVFGPATRNQLPPVARAHNIQMTMPINSALEDLVQRFWSLEDVLNEAT